MNAKQWYQRSTWGEFLCSSYLVMPLQVCSCLALSYHKQQNQTHNQNFIFPKSLLSPSIPKAPSSSSSTQNGYPEKSNDRNEEPNLSIRLSKRSFNLSIFALFFNGFLPNLSKRAYAEEMELQRYTDSKEGFTLLIPSSFNKVEKAGATVLFEEEGKGSNNVGVVVNPVRLSSLGEFGTPEFVVDKLIQAEKRKESTVDAEVIGVAERSGQGGLQVYEFEYKVDSTRGGMKRIFSAAFVASKKLYLLNIAHSDKPESPLDAQTRTMLEQVLHSFDAAPQT